MSKNVNIVTVKVLGQREGLTLVKTRRNQRAYTTEPLGPVDTIAHVDSTSLTFPYEQGWVEMDTKFWGTSPDKPIETSPSVERGRVVL